MYTNRANVYEKINAYNTRYSQAVTHPSTNRARRCSDENRCFQRDMAVDIGACKTMHYIATVFYFYISLMITVFTYPLLHQIYTILKDFNMQKNNSAHNQLNFKYVSIQNFAS